MTQLIRKWFDTKNSIRNLLALGMVLFATVYILLVTFAHVPTANVRVVDTVLGFILGTMMATVINYYFGSSKGSDEKTELLGKEKSQTNAGNP
jgi:hypothetical protein